MKERFRVGKDLIMLRLRVSKIQIMELVSADVITFCTQVFRSKFVRCW